MSVSIENSFAEGDFVEVPATYFDDDNDKASGKTQWSVGEFGTAAKSAVCKGQIVTKKSRNVWSVRFPDGTFNIHFSWLSFVGLPEVPEAQKQKKRTWQEADGDIEISDSSSDDEEISTYNAPDGVFKQVPVLSYGPMSTECPYVIRGTSSWKNPTKSLSCSSVRLELTVLIRCLICGYFGQIKILWRFVLLK